MNSKIRNNIALSKSMSEKIHPFIEPLSDLFGVHTFGYRKFLLNGNSFGISNNLPWTSFCLEKFDKKIIPNYENEIKAVLNEDKSHFFRIGKPDSKDAFLSALYDLDIWNTCSLYKKTAEGVEGFYFATTRENSSIFEKYMNNIGLFERFSHYFKNKLFDIINIEDVNRFSSPTISSNIFETAGQTLLLDDVTIKDFLSITPIHKFFLNANGLNITLSFQEFRCLSLLSQGKTAKEIGKILKISNRTAESYLENVKEKAKVHSRSHLIDLFLLNFRHERDILKYLAK